ncbi:MAG TPA: glycosyltransferase family 39 protein, partial [Thermoanaerobaculia bacterium]|nr:glycosyltransferase family 39 protein [Thermoanaerobaculia bacterium]
MQSRRALWLLCAAFALRGFFLNLALPYGDPLDEIFHFGYAVFLEATGHPPAASEVSMPEELLRPLHFLPRSTSFPGPKVSWSEAARWTPGERARAWREAFPARSSGRPVFVTTNYESQQPPLFYLVAAALLRALKGVPLETRLLILRLGATLAAALTIPIAHAFFRRLFQRQAALLATAAWAAFPGVGSFVGRFTNDALALPILAALLLLFAETARGRLSWKAAALLAALLALGCWTKLYVLLLFPAAPLAGLMAPRHRRRTVVLRALAACAMALLLLSPWILRQRVDTGDWLGLFASKQAASLGVSL